MSAQAKAVVFVVLAATAGGLYAAVQNGNFRWNGTTAQLVVTSVFVALMAHHWLWTPAGIAASLGAGTNSSEPSLPPAKPGEIGVGRVHRTGAF